MDQKKNPSNYRYKKHNPFICISNSLDKKINDIKNKSVYLKINYPKPLELQKLVVKILTKEKKGFNTEIVKEIVKKSQNDVRNLLTILDFIFNSNNFIFDYNKCKLLLNEFQQKNIENTSYEYANTIIKEYTSIDNILDNYNNKSLISFLIYENFVPVILKKKQKKYSDSKKYQDILDIYKNYSIADNIDYNIYINQNWELNNYYCLYTCIETSYILNKNKSTCNTSLNFSTLLNKISQEYFNIKNTNTILNKFKYTESINICDIAEIIKYVDKDKIENIDINKILKFVS